jgi:hypothetical protein
MENDNELFEAFFRKQTAYYNEQLERFNSGEKYTFNVAAFFLGMAWMLYRKMYVEALVLFGILFFEGFFERLLIGDNGPKFISIIINLITAFSIGTLSNYFYLQKAKRCVELAKSKFIDNQERIDFLKKKGGTNLLLLIVVLVIVLALVAYFITVNNAET